MCKRCGNGAKYLKSGKRKIQCNTRIKYNRIVSEVNVDKTVSWVIMSVIQDKSQLTALRYCAKMIIKARGPQIRCIPLVS